MGAACSCGEDAEIREGGTCYVQLKSFTQAHDLEESEEEVNKQMGCKASSV